MAEIERDEENLPEEAEVSLDEQELVERYERGEFRDDRPSEVVIEEVSEAMTEDKERKIFFASLFLAGKPLELKFFKKMFDPVNIENRLIDYAEAFNAADTGLRVRMVSGGFQMVTDAAIIRELEAYFGEKSEMLSRASLETVAIIAYKQPVTKTEVDEIRGVNSSGTMRYLLDRNLVKVIGRKDVPGKPLLYATTKYFMEYFGVTNLSELPTFREWQELKKDS